MKRLLLGVCIVLNLSVASAQDGWRNYDFFGLTGGLADGLEATAIRSIEASDLRNIVFTTGGAISRRNGFTAAPFNTSANPSASGISTGLFFWKQTDGTRFVVRLAQDSTDRIQRMDYGAGTNGPDGTWDNIEGSLSPSFGADDQADFAVALNVLIIEDGVNTTAPYQWSGSGNATALTNAANAQFVEYHKNHLWTGGNNTNPSQIAFSDLCTTSSTCLTTWTATDVINLETNDGQIVRGCKSGLDALYCWKDHSIWRISGDNRDNWVLEQMVRDVGSLSNASLQVVNNLFMFVNSQCDIAVYDGGLNVQIISTKIDGTINGLNTDRCDEASATVFDEDYYVSVSSGGSATHDRLVVYDTFHQAFSVFDGINANALVTFEIGTLEEAIMFGDYSGFVRRYPNGNSDAGTAINSYYQSGWLRFPEQPTEKTFRLARVFTNQTGSGNTLVFEYRTDFAASGTESTLSLAGTGSLWNTAVWDTDAWADLTTLIGRVGIHRQGDFLQWRFENNNTNAAWTVRGVQIWVEETGRIGES